VNAKKVEDKKAHFKQINVELNKPNQLIAKSMNCSQKTIKNRFILENTIHLPLLRRQ
jgi:hypothetical protein